MVRETERERDRLRQRHMLWGNDMGSSRIRRLAALRCPPGDLCQQWATVGLDRAQYCAGDCCDFDSGDVCSFWEVCVMWCNEVCFCPPIINKSSIFRKQKQLQRPKKVCSSDVNTIPLYRGQSKWRCDLFIGYSLLPEIKSFASKGRRWEERTSPRSSQMLHVPKGKENIRILWLDNYSVASFNLLHDVYDFHFEKRPYVFEGVSSLQQKRYCLQVLWVCFSFN